MKRAGALAMLSQISGARPVGRNDLAAKFSAAISKVLQLDAGTRSLPAQ